ncbi:hypothetical protein EYF80_019968 [Liparis tanakae]|uniref:Uncharacterized protein n=1 Tax=Liparis tanakae TaxID=230148 RepID=A0A4Z2HWD3_9TELE|nr:hypothetical protein EYF80_019968 [Liparis tanakae]
MRMEETDWPERERHTQIAHASHLLRGSVQLLLLGSDLLVQFPDERVFVLDLIVLQLLLLLQTLHGRVHVLGAERGTQTRITQKRRTGADHLAGRLGEAEVLRAAIESITTSKRVFIVSILDSFSFSSALTQNQSTFTSSSRSFMAFCISSFLFSKDSMLPVLLYSRSLIRLTSIFMTLCSTMLS